ncbi:MAG: transglutaminase-like domain-containing protein [Candidatus Helarchaeota archaeon]
MEKYLSPTYFIDSDSQVVLDVVESIIKKTDNNIEKAKTLFYWTRDQILYDPYETTTRKKKYKASSIIQKKRGWCVQKATVLAALARAAGIPSRLGFADIKNYQITEKLLSIMKTDLFIYHGFTELFLNGKWIKLTPAFNVELCKKFNQRTVEFDGVHDAILPKTTLNGEKHVEYVKDRGNYPDLPLKEILIILSKNYGFI